MQPVVDLSSETGMAADIAAVEFADTELAVAVDTVVADTGGFELAAAAAAAQYLQAADTVVFAADLQKFDLAAELPAVALATHFAALLVVKSVLVCDRFVDQAN